MIKYLKELLFKEDTWTEDDASNFAFDVKKLRNGPGFQFWMDHFKERIVAKHITLSRAVISGQDDKAKLTAGAIEELEYLLGMTDEQLAIAAELEKQEIENSE